MKKFICILISILCVTALLCACSDKKDPAPLDDSGNTGTDTIDIPLDTEIVGTWNYIDAQGNTLAEMGGWVFNEDGTGVDTVFDLTFTYGTLDGYLLLNYDDETLGKIITKYNYSIKDNILTMKREANGAETFKYTKAQ